jgi:hypothetical protein
MNIYLFVGGKVEHKRRGILQCHAVEIKFYDNPSITNEFTA